MVSFSIPEGLQGRVIPFSLCSLFAHLEVSSISSLSLVFISKALPHFSPALPALLFQPRLSSPVLNRAGRSQPAQPSLCCSHGFLLHHSSSSSAAVSASPRHHPEPPRPLCDSIQTSLPALPGLHSALSIANSAEMCWSCSPGASVSPPVEQYLPLQTRVAAHGEGARQVLDDFMAPCT